ncbi:MAG: hypothetical protein E7345_01930 [Clostridiales bacterium]|nr:hypothetical protein [Clostridiales bacterium]
MQNSHLWFYRLPYSAMYSFLKKSRIVSNAENIVGIKDVVRSGQKLKEVTIFNKQTKNRYQIYFSAYGRCYPTSSGEVQSYIYVEDEKFDKALPKWFQMMNEANDGVEREGSSYPEDFYDYYNSSIATIYDRKWERLTKRDNYTDEQLDRLEKERQTYYNKLCNIVSKYLPIEDYKVEEVEEDINYDDMFSNNPDM